MSYGYSRVDDHTRIEPAAQNQHLRSECDGCGERFPLYKLRVVAVRNPMSNTLTSVRLTCQLCEKCR